MFGLTILCCLLMLLAAVLFIKLILIRKAADEICRGFSDKLEHDTNTLLSISSHDKTMCRLANEINIQLRALQKERRRYQKGDLELKTALTNLSHDLRTPLTAIYGYLDLLENTEKSQTVSRYLESVKNRTELLKQLTEELFSYSYIVSTEEAQTVGQVIVNHVLEESIGGFYAALKERNITPQIHMTEEKIVRILNGTALSRVFSNLISNALKYSAGDLIITLDETGEITFTNTAPGLDEVQAQRLFDRFYTVEAARNSTGLGLSIAKVLLEQMHGEISAEYKQNQLIITVKL